MTNARRNFEHHPLPSTETKKTAFGLWFVYPASVRSCRCHLWSVRTVRSQMKIRCASRFDTSKERASRRAGGENVEGFALKNSDRMIRLAVYVRLMRACVPTCDKTTYQVDRNSTENNIFITSRRICFLDYICGRIKIQFATFVRPFIVLQYLRCNETFYRLRD